MNSANPSAEPRHIVLTGASSGIGAALARHYAKRGCRLSLMARNPTRTEIVARECSAAGAMTDWRVGDVGDAAFMQEWIQECDAQQPIDLVIANAGVGGKMVIAPECGESLAVAHEILTTNAIGIVNTVIPILPRFVARRHGHVVIMSSLAAYVALPDAPVYSASKAAARLYGHGLRRLLSPHQVRVSVVCTGFVATPMSASIPGRLPLLWSTERAALQIAKGIARGRREISFPWPLATLARFTAMLPPFVIDPILTHTRYGSRE